jgi:hypothetical protein
VGGAGQRQQEAAVRDTATDCGAIIMIMSFAAVGAVLVLELELVLVLVRVLSLLCTRGPYI